jgi:hypothetical protein
LERPRKYQLTIDVSGHPVVDARKDAALAAGAEAALLGA